MSSSTSISATSLSSSSERPSLVPERVFSDPNHHPYDTVQWEKRSAAINDETGKALFTQEGIEVPAHFSELATKILASKYFYGDLRLGDDPRTGGREYSLKQVLDRVCGTLAAWGLADGYFTDEAEAFRFRDELTWLCLHQYGAFNSPVWFNLGLFSAYDAGNRSNRGNFFWDAKAGAVARASNPYEYPQCSACFIQSVEDNLESIMELARSEAMLFKFGSGSGSDLSAIRSTRETLTGGGKPSGPLSFLAVYDSVAGVVKSGGKTRRAAKMNTLRADHPDIEEFIAAKPSEERKAWALIEQGYDPSFNGEAYGSVKFQNENLSVRASDAFMQAAIDEQPWWTIRVTDGKPCEKKSAATLLRQVAEGTHLCGDPGMQFDDTINRWHTCAGSGPQKCTNPCSEYLFLDNTACNLASLNLLKFLDEDGHFDAERFAAACRIFIIAQDIIVDRSSYPTEAIAHNSHTFRTLGLGYANLGGLLLELGLPYDSDEGRAMAQGITALMTGAAYAASAELATRLGSFPGYDDARHWGVENTPKPNNHASMFAVMRRHADAVEGLSPQCPPNVAQAARKVWQQVSRTPEKTGFRNAQVTVLAPTGTIGFLMDCDTTGIEPAMGLVSYKSLAGGGMLTLPLRGIGAALRRLGYDSGVIARINEHVKNYGTMETVTVGGGQIASGLDEAHYAVFDTAFASAPGRRTLQPSAHLSMMAAVQPFLSGGISKTVNLPSSATVEEIRDTYITAWRLGLKGVAIYRDGSKRSAPVTTQKKDKEKKVEAATGSSPIQITAEPYRRRLPDTRSARTHKFSIAGTEGYFTVGEFEDGAPGELFIQMAKAGSTINGLMDTIGVLMSLSLQYGVPLETLVKKFSHVRFEPEGMTRNRDIPFAKSVMDYLARWLGMEYIRGYRERMSPAAQAASDLLEDKAPNATAIEKEPQPTPILADAGQLELLTATEGHLTCPECGSSKVKVTGTCACCLNCGSSLGCS